MDNARILVDAPIFALQLLVDGLLVGAIFALAAFGMALVWGVMNIINVVQGEFVILGGFVTVYLASAGFHPMFGVPIAALVLFVLGVIIYRAVIFRVVERDLFTSILATFGISILLQQLMNQLFGADIRNAVSGFGTVLLFDGDIAISVIKLIAFAIVFAVGAILVVFLKSSRLGQAIRATAQNPRAAKIVGVDTDRVYATTYGLNAALCGATGALVVMTWVIHPFIGLIYTVRSFMIVVVAGVGNLAAVVAAGLGLGAVENFAGFILGAEFQAAFVFSLLVIILLWRNFRLSRHRKVLR
ncbi:MAG: branched-chain amino acid ABC transporter permease [Gammaproteobacteria bacterium]|nr:branched-chain amino acid ABC transporter permease [Gammaproteobacteria bacterium]